MSDVTFGVKVPEELRDQINEIMKASGLVGREFMQQLIDSYVMEASKQNIPEMAEEIKELQLLSHRINEIYINLGTRFQNVIKNSEQERINAESLVNQKDEHHEEEIKKHLTSIDKYKKQINELDNKYNESSKANEELKKELQTIKGYNANHEELINEYRSKINVLGEEVKKYIRYKEENEVLAATNKTLQESSDSLASELWFSKREVEKLNKEIIDIQNEYDNKLKYSLEQHKLEQQSLKLELQAKNQEEIEKLNLKILNTQEEYNNKLRDILLQINESKKVQPEMTL